MPLYFTDPDDKIFKEFAEFIAMLREPGVWRPSRKRRLKEEFIRLIREAQTYAGRTLVRVADACDKEGCIEEATLLDEAIQDLK